MTRVALLGSTKGSGAAWQPSRVPAARACSRSDLLGLWFFTVKQQALENTVLAWQLTAAR